MRTDCHRKGAIIPGHYTPVLSYNTSTQCNGILMPSFGVNCEIDKRVYETDENGKIVKVTNGKHAPDGRCCLVGLRNIAKVTFSEYGDMNHCSACGAFFIYGDVWCHEPTGEHIHVGHICADKYGLMMDRSIYELERDQFRQAKATIIQKKINKKAFDEFCAKHHGLSVALNADHSIVKDIRKKLYQWHSLSDKQIAFVRKLYAESNQEKPKSETKIPVPVLKERQKIVGEILSIKFHNNGYVPGFRMTIKVQTEKGYWLCWGTLPKALDGAEKGDRISFEALLKISDRDPSFAFFSRPTKAKILD